MMVITYLSFVVLGLLAAGVQYAAIKSRREPVVGNNPHFKEFQRKYFIAYLPALLADWLQNPYLYKLYTHYGFEEAQIAVLYCCGFASTVLLGTWTPIAADKFGRKKLCIIFTLTYSLSCFFKLSASYGILILGRILSGIATSLLFSAFEAWYVYEHINTHDFPSEWIPVTFAKAQVWNGILAIVGGVTANIIAEWVGFGPVAPFMLAIPCLIFSGIFVASQWPENYGKQQVQFKKSCFEGLRNIVTEPKIFLIGIIQSLFESAMYIFIFIWTPILDPGDPSLGIVFSSFMVCIMIGSGLFQILASKGVPILNLLCMAIVLGLLGNILVVLTTHPDNTNRSAVFVAFLLIEIAIGVYFPAMSLIRGKLVPEAKMRGIMNWFRVPLNLIACAILMALHDETFRHGNRLIFVVNASLLATASLCSIKFLSMVKDDSDLSSNLEDGEEGSEVLLQTP